MELRMYGMVPYQLTGIQKGIQFKHASDEFLFINEELYKEWAKKWKTVVVLNGGTTNTNPERLGTLNLYLNELKDRGIEVSEFYEPDLGDQLTGISFIVDERVFSRNSNGSYKWLEFEDWILENPSPYIVIDNNPTHLKVVKDMCKGGSKELRSVYNNWVEYMGGEKNVFLREFLKNKKLA